MIKHLLYEERYSIEGAKKRIKELRREGELKLFKDEAVAAASTALVPSNALIEESEELEATPGDLSPMEYFPSTFSYDLPQISESNEKSNMESNRSSVDQQKLQELVNELRALTQMPITDLFSL